MDERTPYGLVLSATAVELADRYIAYCGNDCAQCPQYQQGCQQGCLGDACLDYCNTCEVRACNRQRQLLSCAYCAEYPCQKLEAQYAQMKKDGYEHWAMTARAVLKEVWKTRSQK